jgi:hypothetical protein
MDDERGDKTAADEKADKTAGEKGDKTAGERGDKTAGEKGNKTAGDEKGDDKSRGKKKKEKEKEKEKEKGSKKKVRKGDMPITFKKMGGKTVRGVIQLQGNHGKDIRDLLISNGFPEEKIMVHGT